MQCNSKVPLDESHNDTSSYRKWLVLAAYSLLTFGNNLMFSSYAPIWYSVATYYDIEPPTLQWTFNAYYLCFFVIAPISIPFVQWRLDVSMITSALINCVGTWLLWFAHMNYQLALLAYVIIGVSYSIFFSASLVLVEQWFSVYIRTFAMCIATYCTLFSQAVSYSYSSFVFFDIVDQNQINDQVSLMNLYFAIFNTVVAILCILWIRNGSQKSKIEDIKQTYWQQLIHIIRNEEYMLDMFSHATFIGAGWCYLTIVSLQLYTYNLNQEQVSITGILYLCSGIIVGVICSIKLDRRVEQGIIPNYDIYIRVTIYIGFALHLIEALFIEYFHYIFIYIINFFIGVGFNTLYPLSIMALGEKLYPADSLITTTLFLYECKHHQYQKMLGFIINYLLILPTLLPYSLWVSMFTITPSLLYLVLFYKTKYHKFSEVN